MSPVNQTKDVLWPDPKGTVQMSGLLEMEQKDPSQVEQAPPIAATQPGAGVVVKQLLSHGNRLLALMDDGSIWWIVDDRAGAVQWVRLWPNT